MNLSNKLTIPTLFILSTLMWLTRGHHTASFINLPDATWAIFFILGFYFSSIGIPALFLIQAFAIDYLVVTQLGIGDSCFTAAYIFLMPAYLSLWGAGRYLSKHYALSFTSLKLFFISALLGIVGCELISSGSYYWINVPGQASLTEFAARIVQYLPNALAITFAYLLSALMVHLLLEPNCRKVILLNK